MNINWYDFVHGYFDTGYDWDAASELEVYKYGAHAYIACYAGANKGVIDLYERSFAWTTSESSPDIYHSKKFEEQEKIYFMQEYDEAGTPTINLYQFDCTDESVSAIGTAQTDATAINGDAMAIDYENAKVYWVYHKGAFPTTVYIRCFTIGGADAAVTSIGSVSAVNSAGVDSAGDFHLTYNASGQKWRKWTGAAWSDVDVGGSIWWVGYHGFCVDETNDDLYTFDKGVSWNITQGHAGRQAFIYDKDGLDYIMVGNQQSGSPFTDIDFTELYAGGTDSVKATLTGVTLQTNTKNSIARMYTESSELFFKRDSSNGVYTISLNKRNLF